MEVQPSQPSSLEPVSTVRTPDPDIDSVGSLNNTHSLTQATDTSNIRLVFAAVKETILQNALKDSGIL